jgi:hypothetical protein
MAADRQPDGHRPGMHTVTHHDHVADHHGDDTSRDVVRDMVREDRRSHPDRPRSSTASADAVESVRRSMSDLKHDLRMVKVGLDKQGQVLEHIAYRLERLLGPDGSAR